MSRPRPSSPLIAATAAVLLFGLASCASSPDAPKKVEGPALGSSEAQVIAEQGKPERVVTHADGTRSLIYTTQPSGISCWLMKFDADGKLVSNENTLDEAGRAKIVRGMTREALLERLCQPIERLVTRHPYEILSWNVEPFATEQPRRFDVYLQEGRVHHVIVRIMRFQAAG